MKSTENSSFDSLLQKSAPKNGNDISSPYVRVNRYINRPAASIIVRALIRTRVTPNQVSVCSFLLGVLAAFFFALGGHAYFILGGISIQMSSIVDCADGMLARARDESSEYGMFLDLFLDRLVEFFLLLGISYGLYRTSGDTKLLVLGLLAAILYFLEISLFNIILRLHGDRQKSNTSELRALFLLFIMFFALLNILDIGVFIFIGASLLINILLIYHFLRMGRIHRSS